MKQPEEPFQEERFREIRKWLEHRPFRGPEPCNWA